MKQFFAKLISSACWSMKIGWECVGGHWQYPLHRGFYTYVWYNRRTLETRTTTQRIAKV